MQLRLYFWRLAQPLFKSVWARVWLWRCRYVYVYDKRGLELHCLKVSSPCPAPSVSMPRAVSPRFWLCWGASGVPPSLQKFCPHASCIAPRISDAHPWIPHGFGSSDRRTTFNPLRLKFLPHHFLLASVGKTGSSFHVNTSTGQGVAQIRTKKGRCLAALGLNGANGVLG